MRRSRPTTEQLKNSFESMLSMAMDSSRLRTCSGLDEDTMNALRAIARARPNISDELVEAARHAFAGQLDGSNAARWRAEQDRDFAERTRSSSRSEAEQAAQSPEDRQLLAMNPFLLTRNPADMKRNDDTDVATDLPLPPLPPWHSGVQHLGM